MILPGHGLPFQQALEKSVYKQAGVDAKHPCALLHGLVHGLQDALGTLKARQILKWNDAILYAGNRCERMDETGVSDLMEALREHREGKTVSVDSL